MENILLLGFDFSVAKLSTPLTIIGLVLIILSLFLVAGSSKLDELIVKRQKAKKKSNKTIDTALDDEPNEVDKTDDTEVLDHKGESRLEANALDESGELSMWRRKNGTFNYYFLFKVIGLVGVIVSAFMIIFGMK